MTNARRSPGEFEHVPETGLLADTAEQGVRLPVVDLASEYDVLDELGRGSHGVVYRARYRALDREVAIKIVHPAADEPAPEETPAHAGNDPAVRLAREARAVARLQHPNVLSVYAVRRIADGGVAVVMQLAPGRTLRSVLNDEGPLAPDRAKRIVRDVARALSAAHAAGVIHGDVKPENIFLDPETDRAQLSDFGVARLTGPDPRVTRPGVPPGTPAYMAPELVDGASADGRSDLYSLGLTTWEMLTGQHPWEGEGADDLLSKQGHEPLPRIDEIRPPEWGEVSLGLQYVVERLAAKDPAGRWASADAFLADLQSAEPEAPESERLAAEGGDPYGAVPHGTTPDRGAAPGGGPRDPAGQTAGRAARGARPKGPALPAVVVGDTAADAPPAAPATSDSGAARRASRRRAALFGGVLLVAVAVLGGLVALGRTDTAPDETATRAAAPRTDSAVASSPAAPGAAGAGRPAAGVAGSVGASGRGPGRGAARSQVAAAETAAAPPATAAAPVAAPAETSASLGAPKPGIAARVVAGVTALVDRVRGRPTGPASAGAADDIAAADTARPPNPTAVVGTWYHGDRRSGRGDSIALVLRADGSAATLERRYEILIERGALRLISGVRRQGIWAVRYSGSPASRPIELCTAWRIPERVTTCERFAVDTLPEGPLLTFGGRYWRLGPPIDSGTTRSRRGGRSRRPT